RQLGHQFGALQRRAVDRDLVGAGVQHFSRIANTANAAGDTERNIDDPRDALDPVAIDPSPLRAGGDVVEHQLVRAGVAIAQRQLDDVADIDVATEANAFDHATVADVQTRNDAPAQHARCAASAAASSRRPSSNALPR